MTAVALTLTAVVAFGVGVACAVAGVLRVLDRIDCCGGCA